jgi:hypothetical protein
MILSPWHNFFYTILAGFLFNCPIMVAITILYEKYNLNTLTYSTSVIPLIAMLGTMLVIVVLSMAALTKELLDKGCLTWHRDAMGNFVQILVVLICTLTTCCRMRIYVLEFESYDELSRRH